MFGRQNKHVLPKHGIACWPEPEKHSRRPGAPKASKVSAFLEKAAFLLLAAFLVSLAAFCCQNHVLCKTGSRKSAEFGGKSAEFGGKSAESRGSSCQHVGVFVAFPFFLAGGVVCAFRRKFLPPAAGGSRYVCVGVRACSSGDPARPFCR